MGKGIDYRVFLALVKAGLWEQDVWLLQYGKIDYSEVMRFAEEQTVIGLVTAGLEHVKDVKVPQEDLLQFIGQCLQLEQRNIAMNSFVGDLIEKMRTAGIYTLLVKGQGIAQCYERPMWRASGDVDLLLSNDNYQKAISFLEPFATKINEENPYNKHLALTIDTWSVELHGTLRGLLKKKIDKVVDIVQDDVFYGGNVRSWMNGNVQVFLPTANNDVIFIFSHILQHYFKEGIGLRQICDWCRLLWTYRDSIDRKLLESRIREMGILSEWKSFAALAVTYLGMPLDAMPLYSPSKQWSRKAELILNEILSIGQNVELACETNSSYFVRKTHSLWRHTKVGIKHFSVFPQDTMMVWWNMFVNGVGIVMRKR